jgi:hypothetical protein
VGKEEGTVTRLELNHLSEAVVEAVTAGIAVGARIGQVHVEDIEKFSLDAFPEGILLRRRIDTAFRRILADDEHTPPVEPPAGEYVVEYRGDCRSYSVGAYRFERNRPVILTDQALAEQLRGTQGFRVEGAPAKPEVAAAAR